MSDWPDSLWLWLAGGVTLFWFVGAHNRLMRLRTAALQAYATLDAALLRQLEFVQASPAGATGGDASLRAAGAQLVTLLGGSRAQPLDGPRLHALATALSVWLEAWRRLHPDEVVRFDAAGTLSRPAGDPVAAGQAGNATETTAATPPLAWPEPSAAAEIARGHFNEAVARYNAAIGQFPAALVAWITRLTPAATLH